MRKFIQRYIEDVFILGGTLIIIAATFLLSYIAGLYAMGAALIIFGVYFSKNPPGKSEKVVK